MQRDSIANTFKVALILCLFCSVLVSASAVGLRARQQANRREFMQRKILEVAGLCSPNDRDVNVDRLFGQVDARIVDLETGQYDTTIDPSEYDQVKAERDPNQSRRVENDIASISRRETFSYAYEVETETESLLVLPIRGYGLWSTLRGFIALDLTELAQGPDHVTIKGLAYYSHAETPGLGGEVDNERWKSFWNGKKAYDRDWNVQIEVTKNAEGEYQVDALSGATITSRGVSNMLVYWLGEQGFQRLLKAKYSTSRKKTDAAKSVSVRKSIPDEELMEVKANG